MKKYLILLVPLVFLLAQCRKKDPITATTVKGRIFEIDSEVPVANATVSLLEVTGCFLCGDSKSVIETVTTDAKGQYEMSFTWNVGKAYEIKAEIKSDKFLEGFRTKGAGNIAMGTATVVDGFLMPKAWVKVYLKNINPLKSGDIVDCRIDNIQLFSDAVSAIDTTIKTHLIGNRGKRAIILWGVTNNGQRKGFTDSLFCIPHDTTFFEVKL
jgi:hypothetical protein